MAMFAPNVNQTTQSDLTPDYGGTTVAQLVGEGFVAEGPGATAPAVYGAGHPLIWATVIVVGFLFLGWIAHRLGKGEQYANTKVSAVTIMVTGASAVLFIYVLKLLALWSQSRFGATNGFATFALAI
jgi:hypothetical protein